MKRLFLLAVSVLVFSLTFVAMGGGSTATARNAVLCKFVKIKGKKRVSCPKRQLRGKRGRRGRRGRRGAQGPAGPPGAQGPAGAGSGLTLNFNAKLNATEVKQLVIGNFTVRAAAKASGSCENIKLLTDLTASRISIGPAGAFSSLGSNSSEDLQSGNTSNMFTAVTENGTSTVSGIVGRASVGGFCLVSGYVTGV